MKTIFVCLLFLPLVCGAQTYKCQINGKWEYQPYPCANAPSQAVDSRPAAQGMTGMRKDADSMAAREQQQRADASFNPNNCKFQYHAVGDSLGKSLAAAAKEECLNTKGQQGPAYTRWRDHFQTTSNRRDAAAARSQQQQQMNQRQPGMTCRPDGLGGMRCN